ncbi:TetR family transcriptional regulator C-terminal domain-containing protein [Lipingzhangella sp. LS1_29]|uniref:TetR family transcriptional regulator C-terminal domain-containing protein n=1 Tax=Lipingzhangella rawalii TaxID=2055835 RepID=A0ABU2H577_9ACTN|nr:TetR family transcriptional regulator C-terminal domain-containing protein [Lipingzhangella rawalii]MDS1270441.1 TetR family transcriptional regulator C-terminal domain-containing protein [Lipingzhangella rawalii]
MPDTAMDEVRSRVRDIIRRSGWSQRAFSAEIGMEPTKLSKALTGTRRFTAQELIAIAETAGVTVHWLLNGTDDATTVAASPRTDPRERARRHTVASPAPGLTPDAGPEHSRKRQIIDAAWTLIAERGYHAVRVADIAAVCGTSTATVHYHFPTLRDLLVEAQRSSVKQAFDRQVAVLHSIEDLHARLLRLIELQLPHPGKLRMEWSIWLQVWTSATLDPEMQELHTESYRRWHETMQQTLVEGQRSGVFGDFDTEEMTKRLTSLIDGLGIKVVTGMPGRTLDDMRETLHSVVARDILRS